METKQFFRRFIVKKIYVVAILLLVAMLVLTAAIPKPGPKVTLALWNKMINKEAHVSLSGLTNFYTYYLTAKAYDVSVKYPQTLLTNTLLGANSWDKTVKTTYEVRADLYETTVYVCDNPGVTGVMNLTRHVRLVFPLCAKGGVLNQGEPTMEKVNTARYFPGYFDPNGRVTFLGGTTFGWNAHANAPANIAGSTVWCVYDAVAPGNAICNNSQYVGDGYSDGTTDGNFDRYLNGAQVAWALDFYNWDNGGTDIWH